MKTPIKSFLEEYSRSSAVRAHMPGHKGVGDIEKYDITEISGADSLYEASGIIAESEKNASEIFGADTYYSTEGSSLSIRAMLYLVALYAKENGKEPLILAARNVHKSFVSGIALLDLKVEWLFGEGSSYLECKISPVSLENRIKLMKTPPTAVYLTSPDYLGNIQDIKGISDVCRKNGILLLVDNAHGAYLKFLTPSLHPIDLGADICCDSAHKTLPVLTGGAYLHISKNAPPIFSEKAKEALSLFGSTSPSYLILASLDKMNANVPDFSTFIDKCRTFREVLSSAGYLLVGDEEIKITIDAKKYGYLGTEMAKILENYGIFAEFSDPDFLVLMLSPENSDEDMRELLAAMKKIQKKQEIKLLPPSVSTPLRAISAREAMFSPSSEQPVDMCVGKVLSKGTFGCPPAVPILVSGEVISEDAVLAFKYYGTNSVSIVKK